MNYRSILTGAALSACVVSASAQTVLRNFDSLGISNVSAHPQSANQGTTSRTVVLNTTAPYFLEGTGSNKLTHSWAIPGVAAADAYEVGAPSQVFWSIRADATLAVAKTYNTFEVDVYNNSAYPIDAAIMMHDGGYKRHPWVSLTPGAWTKLSWDVTTVAGLPAVTGQQQGLLNPAATAWNFRGIAFHTTTQPTSDYFECFIDNLVGISAQSDTAPPGMPQLLKVSQGSAAGKLSVTWAANPGGDGVTKYTINYLAANAWQQSNQNRLNVAATPAATVDVAGAGSTTGEIDVPVDVPVYVYITATDDATPSANVSAISRVLGARLNADGSAPKNLVVLDNKRFTAAGGYQDFINNGYEQMIAYYGVALSTNNESYVSAVSDAVSGGQQTLTAAADQVVIWSTGLDGNVPATALSAANAAALTAFHTGGGNLLISGANLGDGLFSDAAPAALSTFASDVLKADLVTTNAATKDITGLAGTVPFAAVGDIATGNDVFYGGAGAVTANDALSALSGATAAGTMGTGSAIIYSGDAMAFGFGLEQVRDPAADTPNAAGAAAGAVKRAALLDAAVDYLRATVPQGPTTSADSDWALYQ